MTPDKSQQRKPRVFAPGDPSLEVLEAAGPDVADAGAGLAPAPQGAVVLRPTVAELKRGIRWGALLLSAMAGLASLAAGLAFARFVSEALARNDWVGWAASGLLAVMAVSGAVLVLRELIGFARLAKLARLRREVLAALRTGDAASERDAVKALRSHYGSRPELKWGLARLAEHAGDVRDPGDLLGLADRELMVPLDNEARRLILKSAKRVSLVTALSPMVWIAMSFVLVENLRLLRRLAGIYGGRPGLLGGLKLAGMVAGHIIATGGLALTDDLLGQFLGQDLLRRLSRRLGEGVFNGALTARIGTAAIDVTRPLPYLKAPPVRIRDVLTELFRRSPATQKGS